MIDGIEDENITTAEHAKIFESVSQGTAIYIEPLYIEQELKGEVTTKMQFINRGANPLIIRASFELNEVFKPVLDSFVVSLLPHSTQSLPFTITAQKPITLDEYPPILKMQWETEYTSEKTAKDYTFKGTKQITVASRHNCPRTPVEITVDGNLEEWQTLPITIEQDWRATQKRINPQIEPKTYGGAEDCKVSFAAVYDEQYLYLGIAVVDNKVYVDPERIVHQQDAVEVRLDARPEPIRSLSHGEGQGTWILAILVNPQESLETEIKNPYILPAGTKLVCLKNSTGYAAEIAIPVSYLNKMHGKEWEAFRLNVAVDEFDDEGNGLQLQWWPDWRREYSIPGSGTFIRK
ncbi:MAG: hypothetical protein JXA52_09065 [Planctomycetes bacterium]|nr:hypothetical protein [Planctomycetota bacterium]